MEFEGEDGVFASGPSCPLPPRAAAACAVWAYPIGPHPTYDPEAQLAELTAVQGLLRDSERLTCGAFCTGPLERTRASSICVAGG